jgi:hypothetical protein
MNRDPIDALGERLFETLRRETPPEGAPDRALMAVRDDLATAGAGSRFGGTWLFVVPLAAMLAGVALWIAHRSEPTNPISAEPSAQRGRQPERSPEMAGSTAAPASAEPAPLPNVKAAPAGRPAAVTLADELELLKRAETALAAGDATGALNALDRYVRSVKSPRMRTEATLLRIEALSRTGLADAASALARRFVEENPESPLVDRARSFIGTDPGAASGQPEKQE